MLRFMNHNLWKSEMDPSKNEIWSLSCRCLNQSSRLILFIRFPYILISAEPYVTKTRITVHLFSNFDHVNSAYVCLILDDRFFDIVLYRGTNDDYDNLCVICTYVSCFCTYSISVSMEQYVFFKKNNNHKTELGIFETWFPFPKHAGVRYHEFLFVYRNSYVVISIDEINFKIRQKIDE